MSKWLAETELLQNIAKNLLQPRQQPYRQESIKYKIIEHPQLKQRHLRTKNKYKQTLYGVLVEHRQHISEYCIIFMHGLSSNILEGSTLIDHLLPNTALFCFDFSGSGKSTGLYNTYGLKEHEDIKFVIALLQSQGYKNFILWGRSMGAVACLLQGFSQQKSDKIVLQVVDSPFCNFQQICNVYAKNRMSIPDIFVGSAINVLKEAFASHPFNPFKIQLLGMAGRCNVPTLFVYNQNDEVIPSSNTESLIKSIPQSCYYERIIIQQKHNIPRNDQSLSLIFEKIKKQVKSLEHGKIKNIRKRAIDVYSSFVKKNAVKEEQNLRTTQKDEGNTKKQNFRRSAIYCSLSKKNPSFLSPKVLKKGQINPQKHFFSHF